MNDLWQFCSLVTRDSLVNTNKYRSCASSLLRWSVLLLSGGKQIATTRDGIDGLQRLCEFNIAIASKLNDPSLWIDTPQNLGYTSPMASLDDEEEQLMKHTRDRAALKCLMVIYHVAVPNIPGIFSDTDKSQALLTLIISQLIAPTLRGSLKRHFPGILAINSLASQHLSGYFKLWKKDFWDTFYDPFFFQIGRFHFQCFSKLIKIAISNDTEKFSEIVGIKSINVNTSNNKHPL